jgi:hypothetical protein
MINIFSVSTHYKKSFNSKPKFNFINESRIWRRLDFRVDFWTFWVIENRRFLNIYQAGLSVIWEIELWFQWWRIWIIVKVFKHDDKLVWAVGKSWDERTYRWDYRVVLGDFCIGSLGFGFQCSDDSWLKRLTNKCLIDFNIGLRN